MLLKDILGLPQYRVLAVKARRYGSDFRWEVRESDGRIIESSSDAYSTDREGTLGRGESACPPSPLNQATRLIPAPSGGKKSRSKRATGEIGNDGGCAKYGQANQPRQEYSRQDDVGQRQAEGRTAGRLQRQGGEAAIAVAEEDADVVAVCS